MDEYIGREATIKRIEVVYCAGCNSYNGVRCRACGIGDAIDRIEDAPAADVAPVAHGRWTIRVDPTTGLLANCKCSRCGGTAYDDSKYCPNCGAKMGRRADCEAD